MNDNKNISTNLTVAFNNDFNKKVIENLTKKEHNLLIGLVGKTKNKGLKEVSLSFDEVSDSVGFTKEKTNRIISIVDSLWDKIKMTDYALYVQSKTGPKKAGGVMLFSYLSIDKEAQLVKLKLNPDLEYFLNSFSSGQFTSLKLKDFQATRNKYGKLLFRLLAQYKKTGFYVTSREKLFYLLEKPDSYDITMFHKRILNPALKSIEPFFYDVKVNKVRKGNVIIRYEFTFKVNKDTKNSSLLDSSLLEAPSGLPLSIGKNEKEINYSNNFTNGYIPGKNAQVKGFNKWLTDISFFKNNDEYFETRSAAKKTLTSLYKEKVEGSNKYWTDMRFFACLVDVVDRNKAMTIWNIEDSYASIRDKNKVYIEDSVYKTLPKDKAEELFEFVRNGRLT